MTDDLKTDYEYFVKNKDKFLNEYPNKFIVIKNKQVIGVYEDQVEAFTETTKEHEPGTFIVQLCSAGFDDVQVFRSRVISVG
jgi:hypothetical protein